MIEQLTESVRTLRELREWDAKEIEQLRSERSEWQNRHALCAAGFDKLADEKAKLEDEIERLRAALNEITELDHYPDATIARKALGLPTTDREAVEQQAKALGLPCNEVQMNANIVPRARALLAHTKKLRFFRGQTYTDHIDEYLLQLHRFLEDVIAAEQNAPCETGEGRREVPLYDATWAAMDMKIPAEQKKAPCETCEGRGYLVQDVEWEPIAVACPTCGDKQPDS